MIKITKTILWSLLAFALLSEGNAWAQPSPKEADAMSVRKLDEGLYYMEYKGDDGFAGLMENGGGRSAEELSAYVTQFIFKGFRQPPAGNPVPADFGCSALTARTPEGDVLMGRNFDFYIGHRDGPAYRPTLRDVRSIFLSDCRTGRPINRYLPTPQRVKPEREITLPIQICKSIFQECSLPVFFHI